MKLTRTAWGIVATALLLSACGGGGGDGDAAPAVARAEGVYEGTTSTGLNFQLLVLENDQFYSLMGQVQGGVFLVSSLLTGSGTSNNGSFHASDARLYMNTGAVVTGSVTTTYTPGVSISGTATSLAETATFTGNASASTQYIYDTPAQLADIAGNWSGSGMSGEGVNISITPATGALSGTSALGCTMTGTAAPRASNKNVFNVSFTFGPAPCALPGQSAQGIALTYLLASGSRQLLVAGTTSNRAAGTVFFAQR